MELKNMDIALRSLVIFRGLNEDSVIMKLKKLLQTEGDTAEKVERYAVFTEALFREGGNLTQYLLGRVLDNENIYIQKRAMGENTEALEECLEKELLVLESISLLSAGEMKKAIAYDGYLPEWDTKQADFIAEYRQRIQCLKTRGYGIFSKHRMFFVEEEKIKPIAWPDPIQLCDLKGYEPQRQAFIDNTLALINGRPAANVLLYGDAGTGKSSTVKAVVNAFWEKGLRLVEVKKSQAAQIPAVIEALSRNPLKFILFLDDLSFVAENDDFYALKAVLEGSASSKAPNVVIYATSNRRHLIKESFLDREGGDDVHRDETIQETVSLSARFGLTVAFLRPDRKLYLRIVHELAKDAGIAMEPEQLETEAERFAMSGRSPRVARQFIDQIRRVEV